jgi:erythromycin esterase-like protein
MRGVAPGVVRPALAVAVIALGLLAHANERQSSPVVPVQALDDTDLGSPRQWAFLAPILQDIDVVSLPEPIHMTHEFPLVRAGIVEFLNEHMGFHVLAMEGSAVDGWATQDRFLASDKTEQDAVNAQLALFPLWNTPEIRRLFQYEAGTWSTATPLYITAYDVQPGTGKGTHGAAAFRLLAHRLATYAPPPGTLSLEGWLRDLEPLTGACRKFSPANMAPAANAIDQLERWIAAAAPAIAARFPRVPMHAAALQLVPANLRGSLNLCGGVASRAAGGYKALRDREGALFAERLRRNSPDARLMLWAHWSHLTYSDPGTGVSVGQELRRTLGSRIYTIVPLAERGTAIAIFPSRTSDDDIGFAWVRRGSDRFSIRMQALSSSSFFLDLRNPRLKNDKAFADAEQRVWVESRPVHLHLQEDADAIVWLKHVGPPRLQLPVLLVMGGIHYRTQLGAFGFLLGVSALSVVVWRWRRRRGSREPV